MPRKTGVLLVLLGILIGCATAQLAPRVAEAQAPAAPAADAVEYRAVEISWAFTEKNMKELNALGAQGWRVVSPSGWNGNTTHLLLMRDKRQAQ